MKKKAEYGPLDGMWGDVLWNPNNGFLQNSFRLVEMGIISLPVSNMGWFKVAIMAAGALGLSLENFGRYLDESLGSNTSEQLEEAVKNPNTTKTLDQILKEKKNKQSFLSKSMLIKHASGYRTRSTHHMPDLEYSIPKRQIPTHDMTRREKENFIAAERLREEETKRTLNIKVTQYTEELSRLKNELAEVTDEIAREAAMLDNDTTSAELKKYYAEHLKELRKEQSEIRGEITRTNKALLAAKTSRDHHYGPAESAKYFDSLKKMKPGPDPPGSSAASKIFRGLLGDSVDEGWGKLILRFLTWFIGSIVYMKARDMEKKILSGSAINKNNKEPDSNEQEQTVPSRQDDALEPLFK